MSDQLDAPLASAHHEEESAAPVTKIKVGFLPIETNWFDRLFISVVTWIALALFWMRFLEPAGLSIWIANVIALALAIFIIRKG